MELSRYALSRIQSDAVALPDAAIFDLPEKVLQFGTGVLLRGLPDYYIDKANRQGLFNGRVVVVKSTTQGDVAAFGRQDGMFTLCVRGLQDGNPVAENTVNAAISRVLHASEDWNEVLACARNPELQIIISNTTEVGLELVPEDIRQQPPRSFPGKLLAFLLARYHAFEGSSDSGMVILPTELVPDNGRVLASILRELAIINELEPAFMDWLDQCNHCCSTLVDRIVPGRPDEAVTTRLEAELGYTDSLLTMAEVYRLWAIEGGEVVKRKLTFAAADESVIIAEDINLYRELKLRLLNGTHTLSCGLAFLAGCTTVLDGMNNRAVATYIEQLMLQEIAPAIPYPVAAEQARAFGLQVLDRFRNPHLRHQWLSITLNYSSKIRMRCVPVLLKHYEQGSRVPQLMALGFAAYLCFTRPAGMRDGRYYGSFRDEPYLIQDDQAALFYERWNQLLPDALVKAVLADFTLWGADLAQLPGFAAAVTAYVNLILQEGMATALSQVLESRHLSAAS